MPVPQKSQEDPVSLEEVRNITSLAGLSLLHKANLVSMVNSQCLNESVVTCL